MMTRAWLGLLGLIVGSAACKSSAPTPPASGGTGDAGFIADLSPLDCTSDDPDWAMYGHDVCNTHAAAGDGGITPENVSTLAVKWTFAAAGDISATPAVVGGQIYVPDWGGMLNRIDATTGQAVWSLPVPALAGLAQVDGGPSIDPVLSRVTPIVTETAVIFGTTRTAFTVFEPLDYMVAVDPATGKTLWSTLIDPHAAAVITGSPVLENGRIYVGVSSIEEVLTQSPLYPCCSFRGSVAALDAATGAIVWRTSMIEDSAFYLPGDGGASGYAGAAIWSGTPTIDRKRGQIYVTTGNNYSAPDGGAVVPGDHIESIVALDEATGAIKWSRAMTTGDVWTFGSEIGPDFDFGGGANLFQARTDAGTRDLVGAGQKSGIYWAVDADTGEVVWKTQVGPGGHLGGIHWGTAADGERIYFGVNDELGSAYRLGGTGTHGGEMTTVGSWGALDPASGAILWQVADPAMSMPLQGASVNGPPTVVGGVVLGGSMDAQGMMYAFDARSGDVLWSFASGGTVYGGAAVAGGVVYWGSGYPASRLGFGTESNKLYAFAVAP